MSLAAGSPVLEWVGDPSDIVNQWTLLGAVIEAQESVFYHSRRFLLPGDVGPLGCVLGPVTDPRPGRMECMSETVTAFCIYQPM